MKIKSSSFIYVNTVFFRRLLQYSEFKLLGKYYGLLFSYNHKVLRLG